VRMTGSVVRPPPPTALKKSPLLDWIAQVTVPPVGGGTAVAGCTLTAAAADGAVAADAQAGSPRPLIAAPSATTPAARETVFLTSMFNAASPSPPRPSGRAALAARDTGPVAGQGA